MHLLNHFIKTVMNIAIFTTNGPLTHMDQEFKYSNIKTIKCHVRDKNMGLLVQFSTNFTSYLICTQQPQCTRTNFPIELYQAVGKASSGAI